MHRTDRTRLWTTRPETPSDTAAVHAVNAAAFETRAEADLVDALRQDPAVPDEAMMALVLDDSGPVPRGTIHYPAAFGV
ncbi:hypothetical protein [Streptomyces sp. NBC_01438]|uniref:hypothetical protein n=1 Tax=Streptomyces sp. NBC_01438 TaxID=2903866 RepID=UPI0032559617